MACDVEKLSKELQAAHGDCKAGHHSWSVTKTPSGTEDTYTWECAVCTKIIRVVV